MKPRSTPDGPPPPITPTSAAKQRLDGQFALLSVARKLARRCHHTLRNLDDDVLAPAA